MQNEEVIEVAKEQAFPVRHLVRRLVQRSFSEVGSLSPLFAPRDGSRKVRHALGCEGEVFVQKGAKGCRKSGIRRHRG